MGKKSTYLVDSIKNRDIEDFMAWLIFMLLSTYIIWILFLR